MLVIVLSSYSSVGLSCLNGVILDLFKNDVTVSVLNIFHFQWTSVKCCIGAMLKSVLCVSQM
jgi:hypothetical protein